ncbi:cyclodeaminase/cyclohydrolase family protein [Clostridium hydrogenum]|uniref:cyclodeaminase/cyclohydrolase family protein n=1 Tax=Clostridium hydrogenum TaxID=2855764 RepID=UPI001F1963B8|nr:cyclodeaminase/cyclohydrolase family protein [Clostridium hydrogenum]
MLENLTVKEFLSKLASEEPTPGGGGAAALTLGLSAALNSMVFNLTIGKKVYETLTEDIKELIKLDAEETSKIMEQAILSLDRDADTFSKLMESFKLPKNTEEEKEYRKSKIQEYTKAAAEVPMSVAETSYKLYNLIWTSCRYGNKNLISDAGVAAILVQSTIESSILNIKVNLSSIKDEELKKKMNIKCNEVMVEGQKWKTKIMEEVYKSI